MFIHLLCMLRRECTRLHTLVPLHSLLCSSSSAFVLSASSAVFSREFISSYEYVWDDPSKSTQKGFQQQIHLVCYTMLLPKTRTWSHLPRLLGLWLLSHNFFYDNNSMITHVSCTQSCMQSLTCRKTKRRIFIFI